VFLILKALLRLSATYLLIFSASW